MFSSGLANQIGEVRWMSLTLSGEKQDDLAGIWKLQRVTENREIDCALAVFNFSNNGISWELDGN